MAKINSGGFGYLVVVPVLLFISVVWLLLWQVYGTNNILGREELLASGAVDKHYPAYRYENVPAVSDWQTVENSEYGIRFDVPKDWTVSESDYMVVEESESVYDRHEFSLVASRPDSADYYSVDVINASLSEVMEAEIRANQAPNRFGVTKIGLSRVTNNNYPGSKLTFRNERQTGEVVSSTFLYSVNGKTFVFRDAYEKHAEKPERTHQSQAVYNSFRLL